MMLYTENPKTIRKILELRSKFSKEAGNKINIHKLVAFLYNNDKLSERETKKTIPYIIRKKYNKVPRNKFNQGGKRAVLGKL